jgi:hypothetical protein
MGSKGLEVSSGSFNDLLRFTQHAQPQNELKFEKKSEQTSNKHGVNVRLTAMVITIATVVETPIVCKNAVN